jgi:uncharacterized iron-regulated protein
VARLQKSKIIVLGEKHYSEPIQKAEGLLIDLVMSANKGKSKTLTTAWEFYIHAYQDVTNYFYNLYMQEKISVETFMEKSHGSAQAKLYAPMAVATKKHRGHLLGVNLSADEKAPLLEKGLTGMPPELIPPGFAMGSPHYFKRFELAMAGHGTPEKLKNYYEAQCLADDTMAYNIQRDALSDYVFLITGSFHMEYNDGVVARLKARLPEIPMSSVRVFNTNDYVESELAEVIHDPTYGDLSDYIYFVGEPFNPNSN